MSGQWPPEWEDSDTGLPDEWNDDDTALGLESSLVTSFLASVPSPVLPSAFEARISAAIAAEATTRAEGMGSAGTGSAGTESAGTGSADTESARTVSADTEPAGPGMVTAGPVDGETTDRSSSLQGSSPAATESGPGTSARRRRRTSAAARGTGRGSGRGGARPGGRRRRLRMPSAPVSASLIIVLAVAGFAVLISQFGSGSPTSSSAVAAGGSSGTSVTRPAAEPAASSAAGPSQHYSASQSGPSSFRDGLGARNLKFLVTESGISYQRSTLATQVQTQLIAVAPATSEPGATASSEPSASSSASVLPPANTAPSIGLKGCVAHFTNGLAPSLVDRSTYDGIPAYVIAVPTRVWVVRLGCTAANPEEITSVPLSGLSGNLSALGSVEWYASPGERRMQ
jgi:hypothetical protein